MTPRPKRPKVRYVAREMKATSGSFNYAIYPPCGEFGDDTEAIALYATKKDARRIAAALNLYEAKRRGEL